jgi:hypothetical protein
MPTENKIEYALKLAKDCTYSDVMMESAKEHLRNVIDEALKEVLPQADVIIRLKSISRFNLINYREGEFGIDTEREYDCNGDYIDSGTQVGEGLINF